MTRDDFFNLIPSVARYFTCREISFAEKFLICALGLLYILSPIDLVPDVLPVVGWLDDLGIGALFLAYCSWRVNRVKPVDSPKDEVIDTTAKDVSPEPESILDDQKQKTQQKDLFSEKR